MAQLNLCVCVWLEEPGGQKGKADILKHGARRVLWPGGPPPEAHICWAKSYLYQGLSDTAYFICAGFEELI